MKLVKKNKKITILILAVVASVLAVGSVGVYFIFFNKPKKDFSGTANISNVNYSPPTNEEKQTGNNQKQSVVEQDKLDKQNITNKNAEVVIADASYYNDTGMVEIRGYMANIYEDGGQCNAALTQGSQTVTQISTGFKDATTTQCGAINIPRSKFPAGGAWKLTLTYSSSTSIGDKEAMVQL